MGHRSDVALALSAKGAAMLRKKLEVTGKETRYLFDHPDRRDMDEDRGEEIWRWDHVMWHGGCPEVDFISAFLHELDGDDFLFIRIGEDGGIMERSGGFRTSLVLT